MPKVAKSSKLSRNARRVAAADPLFGAGTEIDERSSPLIEESENLSRGQRKRLARREQFKKREKMIMSSLRLKSLDEKKGINGLDSIREALMGSTREYSKASGMEPNTKITNRGRRRLVSEEVQHMELVLEHPSFKENPFETMQQHLRNTLEQQKAELQSLAKERSDQEKIRRELNRQQKKDRLQGVKKSRKKFNATRSK